MSTTLAQKKRAAVKDDLRQRALNNGTASRSQQIDSAQLIRLLQKQVAALEKIVYSEEL